MTTPCRQKVILSNLHTFEIYPFGIRRLALRLHWSSLMSLRTDLSSSYPLPKLFICANNRCTYIQGALLKDNNVNRRKPAWWGWCCMEILTKYPRCGMINISTPVCQTAHLSDAFRSNGAASPISFSLKEQTPFMVPKLATDELYSCSYCRSWRLCSRGFIFSEQDKWCLGAIYVFRRLLF